MDKRLERGIMQFNAGSFFAAHETWEDLWNDSVGNEKELLRGLIQIAAGYLKVESGIGRGARKLLGRGVAIVRQFLPLAHGLDLAPFVAAVEADLQRLEGVDTEITLGMVQPPQLQRF